MTGLERLRILVVTLEYPPHTISGYGLMCEQVCEWLGQRGHDVCMLTAEPLDTPVAAEETGGSAPVRWTLRSYWDGSHCLYPPFREALAIERHNQEELRGLIADARPDVVMFWHMGAILFALASRKQVQSFYREADVTLFTGMIEHEAFGLVPLEAMASGYPVIATGVGGSGEFCRDDVNCLRVAPGDPHALAAAVHRLSADPDVRHRPIEGGLKTAAELTLDRQAHFIERAILTEVACPL